VESSALRIGDVAGRAGVSVRSLRYYEEQGLLHPDRTTSGQRTYDDAAVERVRLLQRLYAAGLSSTNIAAMLPCLDAPSDHATAESIAVMRREHARLSEQIEDLMGTRDQLGSLLAAVSAHQQQAASAG
jgi:DNA-binding transcriptional MerR regulator